MRAGATAAIVCTLGALVWLSPWLLPGRALLGTHPALFRPFEETVAPERLLELKRLAHPLYTDKLLQHDPEVRFTVDPALRGGGAPTWNPQVLGGLPHLATGLSSALHPTMWISWLVPPPRCYAVIAWLQTALAAWFAFLMLRAFDVRAAAAGAGALLFAASGWMSVHQEYFQLTAAATWLPLALSGAKRLLDGRGGGFSLGAAVGGAFLSGFPQIAVYVLLAPALLFAGTAVVRLARQEQTLRTTIGSGATLALFVALGLGLATPQILPTAEFLPHSTRQELAPDVVAAHALAPPALIGALCPDLLARSRTQAQIEAEEEQARAEQRAPREATLFGLALAGGSGPSRNRFENTFTIGPAALLLALAALLGPAAGRRGARLFFAALLAAGLVLVLPGPLLRAGAHVPGLNVGDPRRALVLVTMALAGLAALGIERVLEDARARRRTLLLLGAAALLLGASAAASTAFDDATIRGWLAPRIARNLGAEPEGIAGLLTADWLRESRELLRRELGLAAGFTVLAVVALWWWHVHAAHGGGAARRRDLLPIGGLLVALAVPLAALWLDTTSPIPTQELDERPALVRRLEREPAAGRIVRVGPRSTMPPWPPKLPMLAGVRDAQGYVAAYLRRWRDLLDAIEPGSTETVGAWPLADAGRLALPLFDALDAGHALAVLPDGAAPPEIPGWRLEPEEPLPDGARDRPDHAGHPGCPGRLVTWRNEESLGRARLVRKVQIADDEHGVLRRLASADFAPREEAWLAEADAGALFVSSQWRPLVPERGALRTLAFTSGVPEEEAKPARVTLLGAASDDLRFEVNGPGGLLVQSDAWYPGWRARLDGHTVPLLRVDHALRGVVVPAGTHVVHFHYVPEKLVLGLFLAPVALAGLFLAAGLLGRGRVDDAR